MRTLVEHKVNPANDRLDITVLDQPGSGGANHHYRVSGFDDGSAVDIKFQHGPIPETGTNGVTHEVLLTIVIDRLEQFQKGQFPSHYNAQALKHLREARQVLHNRTIERMNRGVEGKLEK